MSDEPVLSLEGVWFSYDREPVLQDVSLEVSPGEFVGLVGPNGSGKTTLLRVILGLERPQRGRVRLFGQDLTQFTERWRLGYVPQKAAAFNSGFPATVFEVVLTGRIPGRGLWRFLTREDRLAAEQALELVGMAAFADRPVGRLSGGQQQRVFIARVMVSRPHLLILDEPTVGVDSANQDQFYSLLRKLRGEMGLSIILVSHDIGVVTSEVTRLVCLNRRLFYHGPPEKFDENGLSELYGQKVSLVGHRH